jgi:kynurenine 3-monooxygenase
MNTVTETIAIVGAGPAGSLLATFLAARGLPVRVFERRPDIRYVEPRGGRSINLAVSARGIHGLRRAGLWQKLQSQTVPMKGRMIHSVRGETTFQRYGKNDTEVIYSVTRSALNSALIDAALARGAAIDFNTSCIEIDLSSNALRVRNDHSDREETLEGVKIIAADGAASSMRTQMLQSGALRVSQEFLDYGYKELTIPAASPGTHVFEANALHIWPRITSMLIALPNTDGTFNCTLFLPFEGEYGFTQLDTEAKVTSFFRSRFPDVLPMNPNIVTEFLVAPVGRMVTVKCSPWHQTGNVLLIGDAAHAMVPFFGQGLNCAFEDCTCLLDELDAHSPNWSEVLCRFELERKPNTDAIATLALENFIEMRDRVADHTFLFRKKVELALQARHPMRFVPKYAMVAFHRIPYSIAQERGSAQDRILDALCVSTSRLDRVDWELADRLVISGLTALVEQM